MKELEINVESLDCSLPSGKDLEELLVFAGDSKSDPSKVIDRGPGGHHYYDDAIGEDVVSWCFAYARKYPEDEYIQDRVKHFRTMNQSYKKNYGKDMPGYDASYFKKNAIKTLAGKTIVIVEIQDGKYITAELPERRKPAGRRKPTGHRKTRRPSVL